jgi:multidrug resistance efflux pump
VTGHVESIGRGIEDDNGAPGHLGLPNVAATFSWVRLAQRIRVHIHIDKVPAGVLLVAGMSAQVEIAASEADGSSSIKRDE